MKLLHTLYVKCTNCSNKTSLQDMLNLASVSWPNKRWFMYVCPNCGEPHHIEVSSNHLIHGILDGAPGPTIREQTHFSVSGLSYSADSSGIRIEVGGSHWFIPAKN